MTTVTTTVRALYPGKPATAVAAIAVITGRNLRRLVRVPTLLVFATLQPVLPADPRRTHQRHLIGSWAQLGVIACNRRQQAHLSERPCAADQRLRVLHEIENPVVESVHIVLVREVSCLTLGSELICRSVAPPPFSAPRRPPIRPITAMRAWNRRSGAVLPAGGRTARGGSLML
jgi:hypothetical protein